MTTLPDAPAAWPPPPEMVPLVGGLQFKDAAPMICGVVDNGVCQDDPRVLVRLNEATKIILDTLIPVGGMQIAAIQTINKLIILPPTMENIIEFHGADPDSTVYGKKDTNQAWCEIVSNTAYLDPDQAYDNPLVDFGLNGNPDDPEDVRRIYSYPGLDKDTILICTGAKRYIPLTNDEDYLIVQNIEAIKCIILSIERYENNAIQEAQAYRQEGINMLQSEVKKHLLDPRNYMVRRDGYYNDLRTFPVGTMGYTRAQIALDIPEGLHLSRHNLNWAINQAERRLMERGIWKDTITTIQASVVGGFVYFPIAVEAVLAINLNGRPIPIRSQFFEYLENGPGFGCNCDSMLVDQGTETVAGSKRRKYKLVATCSENSCLSAVCKLRWVAKEPNDQMVIRNYEAIRLMMVSKFMEEKQDFQNAQQNMAAALDILDKELRQYLGGIRHTVHVQTYGFGLGDVGRRTL